MDVFGWSFVGALAYADDIVLLAPLANAVRRMLSTSNDYGAEYSVHGLQRIEV